MEALNAVLPLKTRLATLILALWIVWLANGLDGDQSALYLVVVVPRLALDLSRLPLLMEALNALLLLKIMLATLSLAQWIA
jgi:hypothetical protein